MPKKSKEDSARVREIVIQDIIAGNQNLGEIAAAHGLGYRTVTKIKAKYRDRIEAAIKERLEARQAEIDAFLEQEQADLLEICRMASIVFKTALKKHQELILSEAKYFQTEILVKEQKKEPGKPSKEQTIRSKPVHDLETALQLYKETHAYLMAVQKNGAT